MEININQQNPNRQVEEDFADFGPELTVEPVTIGATGHQPQHVSMQMHATAQPMQPRTAPVLKPNPNLQAHREQPKAISQQPASVQAVHQNIVDAEAEQEFVQGLEDLLADHPNVKVTTRFLLKLLLTDDSLRKIDKYAANDYTSVDVSSGKSLNFYSPFRIRTNETDTGFLRKPILNLLEYFESNNNAPHIIALGSDAKYIEALTKSIDNSVSRLIYNAFGGSDVVTYILQNPDLSAEENAEMLEEGEELDYYSASDFVHYNTWVSTSVDTLGMLNVNYTVALNVHPLELYLGNDRLKFIDDAKQYIEKVIKKFETTNVTVAFAPVFDIGMMKVAAYRKLLNDLLRKEDGFNEYTYYTHEDISEYVEEHAEDGEEYIEESMELMPKRMADVDLMLGKSEIMLYTILSQSVDSLYEEENSENEEIDEDGEE